jgi:multidrug efflux pump subunit AcrA (membrane-fusion protein)
VVLALGLAVLAAVALLATRSGANGTAVPTAEVKRGEWVEHVELRGEIKALRSLTLSAPSNVPELQILKLVPSGSVVKAGDVVLQFDTTKRQRALEEEQAGLKQADAEIEKTRAQGRIQDEQTRTDLMKAEYDVERARLEASKQEILAEILGEKTKLTLSDTEQKLSHTRAKARASRVGGEAELERARQKRGKALFEVEQGQRSIAAMSLRAPADGMITVLPNYRVRTSFGSDPPEFKEGDRVWSGALIAELPDLSRVRVAGRVEESDRGRVTVGQAATVRVDAVPDREFAARVAEISPLAKLDFSSWPPMKNFDLVLEIVGTDARLRPGMSATGRIVVDRTPGQVLIPAQACFDKGGRTVAYVRRGWRFRERPIEIARRTPRQVAVARGLEPGDRVALQDPTLEAEKTP